jgi:hypothetical protein
MYAPDIAGTASTSDIMEVRHAWPVAENIRPEFRLPSAEMESVHTSDYNR